jgi:hypothetical protein
LCSYNIEGLFDILLELNHVKDIGEVFHELLEVDNTIAIDVGCHCNGDDLLLCQVDVGALCQALCVFGEVKSAVHVSVVLLEGSEKLHGVQSFVNRVNYFFLSMLFLMDLINLLFFNHGIKLKVLINENLADFGKLTIRNLSITITV